MEFGRFAASPGQMSKSVGAPIEKPALQSDRRSLVDRFPYLYVLPATIMFVGFVAYPILWVVGESTRGADGKTYVGLEQYTRAFSDPVFWRVLWNMFLWGAVTIPAQMVIGVLLLALLLSVVQIVVLGSRVNPHANILSPK